MLIKKKPYYYLFLFIFAGNRNHIFFKKEDIINIVGTTVDALGKEHDDEK